MALQFPLPPQTPPYQTSEYNYLDHGHRAKTESATATRPSMPAVRSLQRATLPPTRQNPRQNKIRSHWLAALAWRYGEGSSPFPMQQLRTLYQTVPAPLHPYSPRPPKHVRLRESLA